MNALTSGVPRPIPQVGAVLRYSGPLVDGWIPGHELAGSFEWQLAGACVLISPPKALSIRHIFEKGKAFGVFLPWVGIVPLRLPPDAQDERWQDSVVLCDLLRPVVEVPPLAYRRHRSDDAGRISALTGGYGLWTGVGDEGRYYGLQRVQPVETARARDRLDLDWTPSDNGGFSAGALNSGGPVMYREGDVLEVVGVTRSSYSDCVSVSRIAGDRFRWLRGRIGRPIARLEFPREGSEFRHERLRVANGDRPREVRFAVPDGASSATVTLHSTCRHERYGLMGPLQMAVAMDPAESFSGLETERTNAGSFLTRRVADLGGQDTLRVAVAPFRPRPWDVLAGACTVELCVRFDLAGSAGERQ